MSYVSNNSFKAANTNITNSTLNSSGTLKSFLKFLLTPPLNPFGALWKQEIMFSTVLEYKNEIDSNKMQPRYSNLSKVELRFSE